MRHGFCGLGVAAVLMGAGCATPDQRIQSLTERNQALVEVIAERERTIADLEKKRDFFRDETDYFTKRSDVLKAEKQVQEQENRALRKGVRGFTDEIIESLEKSYRKIVPADYVGSEIIARGKIEKDANVLVVDQQNIVSAGGTLIGARAYVVAPTTVRFCVLRPDKNDANTLRVAWISDELLAEAGGAATWTFAVPAVVQEGDMIGVHSPDTIQIPYDDVDTGRAVLTPGKIKLEGKVERKPVEGRNGRTFSFGCTGYFDVR